jgi:hypothetical protein
MAGIMRSVERNAATAPLDFAEVQEEILRPSLPAQTNKDTRTGQPWQ